VRNQSQDRKLRINVFAHGAMYHLQSLGVLIRQNKRSIELTDNE